MVSGVFALLSKSTILEETIEPSSKSNYKPAPALLNKADERLFSHFENETIDYNYIIIKENNEYIFNVNSGGKYD